MALKKWIKRTGTVVMDHSGMKVIYLGPGEDGYRELFDLTDYVVRTVGAGVVWLARK